MISREDVQRITRLFEEDILAPKIAAHMPGLAAMRDGVLEKFQDAFVDLVADARFEFRHFLELPLSATVPSELDIMFCGRIAYACNRELAPDHPFVIAIVNIENNDDQTYYFGCVRRRVIQEQCGDLAPGMVPIITADTYEHFQDGLLMKIEVVNHPDDLRYVPPRD